MFTVIPTPKVTLKKYLWMFLLFRKVVFYLFYVGKGKTKPSQHPQSFRVGTGEAVKCFKWIGLTRRFIHFGDWDFKWIWILLAHRWNAIGGMRSCLGMWRVGPDNDLWRNGHFLVEENSLTFKLSKQDKGKILTVHGCRSMWWWR